MVILNITAIKKQKGKKGEISIFVDGKYSFSVREEDYFKLCIYPDMEITDDEIHRLKNISSLNEARAAALSYIELRVRCKKDVETKLRTRGYRQNIIKTVIDDLVKNKYIDDEIFAKKYINDRNKLKPRSKMMLKYELLYKGIDEDIIDRQLAEVDIDEQATAYMLAQKKFGKYDVGSIQVRKKLIMFLKRRGYSDEIIKITIDSLMGAD